MKKQIFTPKIVLCRAFVLVGLLSLSSIGLAQEPFTKKNSMPTARLAMGTAVVDGKIYLIGGWSSMNSPLSVVEVYDPVTDNWDTKTPMPTARGFFGCTVVDGKIYAIGGGLSQPNPLSIVEVYDPVTDSWDDTTVAHMPTARSCVAACTVNGKIYVIGGTFQDSDALEGISIVEEYDPATNTWTTKADKPTPVWGSHACVVNGKIYIAGGNIKYPNISAVLEVYDPVKDEWDITKAPMPKAKYSHSICAVNKNIYSFGGWNNCSTGPFYTKVEVYNPTTDKWIQGIDLPLTLAELSSAVVGNKIYIMGGTSTLHPLTRVNKVYEYDPHLDLLPLIENIELDKDYAKPGKDNVCITAKISDPAGITIMVHIEAPDQSPVDSMQLFDDGNHNDDNAGDSLYANVWLVNTAEEQQYYMDLKVKHVDTDTVIHYMNNMATFTTIGPVEHESYTFTGDDTIPDPGDQLKLEITLKNNGLTATAKNIKAQLTSNDTIVYITPYNHSFDDIPAGESAASTSKYTVRLYDEHPVNTEVPIIVHISSDDYVFWRDTFSITVEEPVNNTDNITEPITRIYPNPASDQLNLEFTSIPEVNTIVELMDISGKIIYSGMADVNSTNHTIDLHSFKEGLYLISISNDEYTVNKKIIKVE